MEFDGKFPLKTWWEFLCLKIGGLVVTTKEKKWEFGVFQLQYRSHIIKDRLKET